jgi:hypothetical protein
MSKSDSQGEDSELDEEALEAALRQKMVKIQEA